jgi:hypothetical protein
MRLAAAALTLLLLTGMAQLSLTGMAHAQATPGLNLWADDGKPKDPEAEAKREEIDRAYREKTKSQAAPATANDPWGAVRASDKPASQSKSQSSGSKTDNKTR